MTWLAILSAVFFNSTIAHAELRTAQVTLQFPEHVVLGKQSKRVQIDVLVPKGFHVQANPASREGLIPTEIQIEPSPLFQYTSFIYPKGTPFRLAQGTGEILTYVGNFPVSFELAPQASGEKIKERKLIKGVVHYQACDDHVCMRPSSAPFEIWVENPK